MFSQIEVIFDGLSNVKWLKAQFRKRICAWIFRLVVDLLWLEVYQVHFVIISQVPWALLWYVMFKSYVCSARLNIDLNRRFWICFQNSKSYLEVLPKNNNTREPIPKNNNTRKPTPEVLQKLENCPTLVRTLKKIISVNLEQCANFHVPERRPFVSIVNFMENAKPLLHYHTSLASIVTTMEKPMKALPKMSLHPPLVHTAWFQ